MPQHLSRMRLCLVGGSVVPFHSAWLRLWFSFLSLFSSVHYHGFGSPIMLLIDFPFLHLSSSSSPSQDSCHLCISSFIHCIAYIHIPEQNTHYILYLILCTIVSTYHPRYSQVELRVSPYSNILNSEYMHAVHPTYVDDNIF